MKGFNQTKVGLRAALLASAGAAALFTGSAIAQDDSDDRIVVTGTRIAQGNLDSPTPIHVFNTEQIELSGAVNTAEILRTLPAIGVSALTTTNSNFLTGGSGINTVELRNLGGDRTLVLVNGRRFVSGLPGSQRVDFNSIPTEFIERLDVVTGGASAVYGSDALAGVVNIILKNDFEGVVSSFQAGVSEDGDNENYRASTTFGSTFAEGRGNSIVSLNWSRNNGVQAADREGLERDGLSCAYFGCPNEEWQDNIIPYYSSYSERGRIVIPGGGNLVFDETTGTVRPFVSANADGSELDGFNRQAYRTIAVPTERINFAAVTNYEINRHFNLFFEGTYAATETQSRLEPFPLSSEDVFGLTQRFLDDDGDSVIDRAAYGIPILNPFVPEDIRQAARDAAIATGDGAELLGDEDLVVGFVRRTTELTNRGAHNIRQTGRVVLGMDGELTDTWNYEVSMNFGRTTQAQNSTGQVNVLNMRNGFDVESDGNGGYQCVDEVARIQGCVPVNIFGKGSISPEAAAYISAPSSRQATLEQLVINGFVTGELGVSSPWAEDGLSAVFGAEYRTESSISTPDALSQGGLNAGNVSPVVSGSFNVAEVFSELSVPIVQGHRFAEDLRMNFAIRMSDYSTVGKTLAWAANGEWAPSDSVRFRAQYSRAVRAPNIGELFQPLAETFAGAVDVCEGLTLSGGNPTIAGETDGGVIAAACYADPALVARIARDGIYNQTQPELQGIGGFNGGNVNLFEETGTTITVGAIFTPHFGNKWIDNLSVSVDYFQITIDDAIQGLGRQTSVGQCYGGLDGTFASATPFCTNIRRYQPGDPSVGAINEIDSLQQNIAELETAGYDVQASYNLPLNDIMTNTALDLGDVTFTLAYQYLDTYNSQAFPGANISDNVGLEGLGQNEVLLGAVYRRGPLTFAYDVNWLDDVVESNGLPLESAAFQDIQARLEIGGSTQLVFGIDNFTDEFVRYGLGLDVTGTGTDGAIYDAIGRRFYVGARTQF